MDHSDLCQLAVNWLRRPQSRRGPGCQVAISEPRCGYLDGEIPDAIGFRCGVSDEASVVVEAKVSRADFLADANKPHRITPSEGVGAFRYYLAPAGLIQVAELPPKWGLIEVTDRRVLKVRAGYVLEKAQWAENRLHFAHELWHHERAIQREWSMLVRLMMKIGDVEETQQRLRGLFRTNAKLGKDNDALRRKLDELRVITYRNERMLKHPDVQKVLAQLTDCEEVAMPRKQRQESATASEPN